MCEPVTILTTLAIASTAASIVTEMKSAKRQNKAIGEAFTAQQAEIGRAQTAEINERQRAAQRERGRIRAAASQAGLQLGSGSIQAMLADSDMQAALSNERTSMNADTRREASAQEANSMYSRVESPSVLGAGLRLASAGANAYFSGQGLQIQRANAARGPQ
ncbi:MAG: hypothetical protein ACK4UQ_06610 [Brevundimonas sp.]